MPDTGPAPRAGHEEVEMRIVPSVCGWLAATVLLLAVPACAGSESDAESGTELPENEYGFEVVDDKDLYLQTVAEDPSK